MYFYLSSTVTILFSEWTTSTWEGRYPQQQQQQQQQQQRCTASQNHTLCMFPSTSFSNVVL